MMHSLRVQSGTDELAQLIPSITLFSQLEGLGFRDQGSGFRDQGLGLSSHNVQPHALHPKKEEASDVCSALAQS